MLTGSARLLTFPEMADALVGRVEVVELWPFSEVELAGSQWSVLDMIDRSPEQLVSSGPVRRAGLAALVVRGGFPEATTRTSSHRRAPAWSVNLSNKVVHRPKIHLDRLGDRFHHGYLATTAPEAHPLEERISAIPVTALWNPSR